MRAVILACLLLAGCSSMPGLYAELGAGYKLRGSDVVMPWCHTVTLDGGERSCGGDNPTTQIAFGFEFENGGLCEYAHDSHAFDGGQDREFWLEQIRCAKRWGGR